jgi:hypothetical protein
MKKYHATYGVCIRAYAQHNFEAANDEAAKTKALEEFKEHQTEMAWSDFDHDNLALPSIVGLRDEDNARDILQGYDFAITTEDARDPRADSTRRLSCPGVRRPAPRRG